MKNYYGLKQNYLDHKFWGFLFYQAKIIGERTNASTRLAIIIRKSIGKKLGNTFVLKHLTITWSDPQTAYLSLLLQQNIQCVSSEIPCRNVLSSVSPKKLLLFFFFFTVRLKSSEATDVEVSENEMQTLNEKGDGHVFKTFQIDYNYYYYYHYLWIGFNRTTSRICIGFISVKLFHTVVWLSDACSCHWTIFIIPDPFEHFTLNCSLYCM